MASRGRGHRGRPRGTPPVFDQHAFVEAMGSAATTIAQASTAGDQGGGGGGGGQITFKGL